MRFLRDMSVVAAALASSGCLTLYEGVRQPIIVSSSPVGAQVFLDGEPVGAAPLEVAVDRGSEPTFLVESDGFEPTALRLRRRVNPWIAVDLAVGALAFYATGAALIGGGEGDLSSPLTLLAVLAGAAPALVDFNSGAAYALPRRVHAVLRPTARDWSALRLKPSSQESVRPVQPDCGVLLRDVQPLGDPVSVSRCVAAVPPRRTRASSDRRRLPAIHQANACVRPGRRHLSSDSRP